MNLDKRFTIYCAAAVARGARGARELTKAGPVTTLVEYFAGITAIVIAAEPRASGRISKLREARAARGADLRCGAGLAYLGDFIDVFFARRSKASIAAFKPSTVHTVVAAILAKRAFIVGVA